MMILARRGARPAEGVVGPRRFDLESRVEKQQLQLSRKVHVAFEIAHEVLVVRTLEAVVEEADGCALHESVEARRLVANQALLGRFVGGIEVDFE